MQIDKLAIIGVGLIGGSLARALRKQGVCNNIVGCGRHTATLEKAIELGVIDEFTLTAAEAVVDADVVVLATPLSSYEKIFKEIAPCLDKQAVITDVGSAKGSVVAAARDNLGSAFTRFVPGHPIAGAEKNGVEASFAELFEHHRVILTPIAETDEDALQSMQQMWQLVGADVVAMEVEHHDSVLAATSHLPHMLAYALVDCLASGELRDEIFQYAAGGFADFTRIASSSPEMWHDICFSNREHLLQVLERFDDHLNHIKQAIREGDSARLLEIFTRAKQARDRFTDLRQAKQG